MHRILLAGQNGIIGSFLYETLKNNFEVYGIGKGEFNSENYLDIDLTKHGAIENFVKQQSNFDVLIFLVGLAHAKGKNQDYPVFEKINFITLFNLLESMKKENKVPKKIIFASTISVYGEKINVSEYKETDELSPNSPYAKTKIIAEKYLNDNFKANSWILRFAPVYSDQFNLNIERRTKIKGKFYKVGNGTNRLSLLNIKNISFATKQIIDDEVAAGTYNLADEESYSYNQLLESCGAANIFTIPKFLPKIAYIFGKIMGNIFLIENSTKLLTDNLYSTNKLNQFIKLPYTLKDK